MEDSEAVKQAFSRIQSLFRDYQELNEQKIESYEGEIGDFIQRRDFEKKFKAKGNIAHSNLNFQRATDEHAGNPNQRDDLLSLLNSLLLDDSQLTAIEFDSDIFDHGKQHHRQYFFQPGEVTGVMNDNSLSNSSDGGPSRRNQSSREGNKAANHKQEVEEPIGRVSSPNSKQKSGKTVELKVIAENEGPESAPQPQSSPSQPPKSPNNSPPKTRATTAGTTVSGGLSDVEEEEDFAAEMRRNKYEFETLVDKAQHDSQIRVEKFKECLARLKLKQKEMVFRILDKYKKEHSYHRMKNRLVELDSLLLQNKSLLAEKKYALQVKKAQSNVSAEELRRRFEYETEQQVRHLVEQVDKRKHDIDELSKKRTGIEEEIDRLLKEMSVVLFELEKEEKALPISLAAGKGNKTSSSSVGGRQTAIHKTNSNDNQTNSNSRPLSPSHQVTSKEDDIHGIFEVFPFLHHNPDGTAELTDEMIDQALKVVESTELKLTTLKGMVSLAEEDYAKKKTVISNLLKGEDNKANDRLKKMCMGLEQKIASDERRVELLENLINGLKRDKSDAGGGSMKKGGNNYNNNAKRSSSVMGAGGSAKMNRQSFNLGRLGSGGVGLGSQSKEEVQAQLNAAAVSKSLSTESTGAVPEVALPLTPYHSLLKQYLEHSFLSDLVVDNTANAQRATLVSPNGETTRESTISPSNAAAIAAAVVATNGGTTGPTIDSVLTNDKMEEIINQYRIIAPHQVQKLSKSIEVFQDVSSSKLQYVNAIVPPSQHLTTFMSTAMAASKQSKSKPVGGTVMPSTAAAVAAFSASIDDAGNRIENVPGTRPADFKVPRDEALVETVAFEGHAYNIAVEQLNTIFGMLLKWNKSSATKTVNKSTDNNDNNDNDEPQGELSMRTEEEELEVVEDLRHQINKVLELLKTTYKDGQQVQRVYKDLSHDFNEQLRACDRLRAELLREVEGLQWSSMLQPGQYQVEIESCKNRIVLLKQQLKAMEERVASRRKTNIRLSQLLTDKRIYPTDITSNKFW